VVHGGGLTAMKKAADFAALYQVQTGCHGASDMSPVCMAAALHLGIAINNFGIQEHMLHNTQTEETFAHDYVFREGFMYPGDMAGLGVDIREDIAANFPYQRAYLPVNRKEDGTLFHW
jgi:mannonate dehydratase